MTTNYRDALTGQYTTAADAAARPAETVAETVPTRHETPDVAELRRRLDALPGFILKYLGGRPGVKPYITLAEGEMPLSDSGWDAVLLFAEIAALEVPRLLDRLAHMTEARDNARAEVERLTGQIEAVRALHASSGDEESQGYLPGGGYGFIAPYCTGCVASDEYATAWPCATIRALDATPGAES